MTQEVYLIDVDEIPGVGDDQLTDPVQTVRVPGHSDNLPTVLVLGVGQGGGGDTTPPTVALISPLSGSLLPGSTVVLRVTDGGSLSLAMVLQTINGRPTEVVHDGDGYRVGYKGTDLAPGKVVVTDGYELHIQRTGGWHVPLDFEVAAVDDSGN